MHMCVYALCFSRRQMGNKGAYIVLPFSMKPEFHKFDAVVRAMLFCVDCICCPACLAYARDGVPACFAVFVRLSAPSVCMSVTLLGSTSRL